MKSHLLRFAVVSIFAGGLAAYAADSDSTTEPTTGPSTQSSTEPSTNPSAAINWDQAKDHVGETVTVTGPVIGTHAIDAANALVLNVGKDFPDPDRFTVFLTGGEDGPTPPDIYQGKTITVTGQVQLYKDVPEIKAGAKDITVK